MLFNWQALWTFTDTGEQSDFFALQIVLLIYNGQALWTFTGKSDFLLYKYYYCYLMDRLSERLPTWVNKVILLFINTFIVT